jgi:hypothetical protein
MACSTVDSCATAGAGEAATQDSSTTSNEVIFSHLLGINILLFV